MIRTLQGFMYFPVYFILHIKINKNIFISGQWLVYWPYLFTHHNLDYGFRRWMCLFYVKAPILITAIKRDQRASLPFQHSTLICRQLLSINVQKLFSNLPRCTTYSRLREELSANQFFINICLKGYYIILTRQIELPSEAIHLRYRIVCLSFHWNKFEFLNFTYCVELWENLGVEYSKFVS